MKHLFLQISICLLIVFLNFSCIKLSSLRQNSENSSESINDTTAYVQNNEPEPETNEDLYDNVGDEENEHNDIAKNDALYTKHLPGTWSVDLGVESGSDSQPGVKSTYSISPKITMVLNKDFSYTQRFNMRVVMDEAVEYKWQDGGMMRTNVYKCGVTIDIDGERKGTWYVDNSNLVQQVESWSIKPSYHKHHGESSSIYRDFENVMIKESSSMVKELMDDMKSFLSLSSSLYIVEMPIDKLRIIGANGEEMTFIKK